MIKVVDFKRRISTHRIGELTVRYYDMLLKCELCVYRKETPEKLWVKMPEIWIRGKKNRYVYWSDKSISDTFQQVVLCDLKLNWSEQIKIPLIEEINKIKFKSNKLRPKNNKLGKKAV